MTESGVYIIVLAAGASRRMRGVDKLMQIVDGMPLLRRSVGRALASAAHGVHVILPRDNTARIAALSDLPIVIVPITNNDEGLSASVACGIRSLPNCAKAAIILPADMPDIAAEHLDLLIARWQRTEEIIRSTTKDGKAGNPVLFPRKYFEALQSLEGDKGARVLLKQLSDQVEYVALPGQVALTDLDTPEDWEAWFRRNKF